MFMPAAVARAPDGLSNWQQIRRGVKSLPDMWPESLYKGSWTATKVASLRFVHVADPDLIQEILVKRQPIFPKSPGARRMIGAVTGNGMLATEFEQWRKQRRAAAPAFRHIRIMELVPMMIEAAEEAASRLSAIEAGTVLDMHEEMIRITMEIITRTLFTAEIVADNREAIAHDVSMMVTELGRFDMLDAFGAPTWIPRIGGMKGRAAVQRVRALAMQGLQSRKGQTEGRLDLLSLMMEAKDPETGIGLTDDEIADNVVTFIAAGHETTALALTWVLYLVANLPEWQDRLREEVAAVFGDGPLRPDGIEKLVLHERVIKEAMRLYPPATAIGRSATENTDLGSLQVTPKDRLVLAIYALHRNERLWDDPNTFNPDRFLPEEEAKRHRYAYIPFSAGPRICIGAKFAMLEAQATLAAIMRSVRFEPDPNHEVSLRSTITLRPATGMLLKVAPL